jgi:hypothetical protein
MDNFPTTSKAHPGTAINGKLTELREKCKKSTSAKEDDERKQEDNNIA